MKSVTITLDGKEITGECPLDTTVQDFLRAHLQAAPTLLSLASGEVLSPRLTLVHRCAGECFSTEVPSVPEVPTLVVGDLLAVSSV